jgi:hypothetical protein
LNYHRTVINGLANPNDLLIGIKVN